MLWLRYYHYIAKAFTHAIATHITLAITTTPLLIWLSHIAAYWPLMSLLRWWWQLLASWPQPSLITDWAFLFVITDTLSLPLSFFFSLATSFSAALFSHYATPLADTLSCYYDTTDAIAAIADAPHHYDDTIAIIDYFRHWYSWPLPRHYVQGCSPECHSYAQLLATITGFHTIGHFDFMPFTHC